MKKVYVSLCLIMFFLGTPWILPGHTTAAEITAQAAYNFRDTWSANNVFAAGWQSSDRITYGAFDVTPNGYYGTTGTATYAITQNYSVQTPLHFIPYSIAPNIFGYSVDYNPIFSNSWNLTFKNGSDTASILTPALGSTTQALPYATNVSVSGQGLNPTFSWSVPGGTNVDYIRLNIFDLSAPRLPSGEANNIHFADLASNATSYTIPDLLSSNMQLQSGHQYSFSISLIQTRDGEATNTSVPNMLSRSRSFFEFTPLDEQAPPSVYLPIVTPGQTPVYTFHADVVAGQTIYIDPTIAVGYDYSTGNGDPNFKSVTLPTGIGDDIYALYIFDPQLQEYVFKGYIHGGDTYTFDGDGVGKFRILGIEPSAALNPNDVTAFVTGLSFIKDGTFTGTMTPITQNVPEPCALLLLFTGIIGVLGAKRKMKE